MWDRDEQLTFVGITVPLALVILSFALLLLLCFSVLWRWKENRFVRQRGTWSDAIESAVPNHDSNSNSFASNLFASFWSVPNQSQIMGLEQSRRHNQRLNHPNEKHAYLPLDTSDDDITESNNLVQRPIYAHRNSVELTKNHLQHPHREFHEQEKGNK